MQTFVFQKRDLSGDDLVLPDLDYRVVRYSWAAIGGPLRAEVRVRGDDLALWSLLDGLRRPGKIYSANGDALWWGKLSSLQVVARRLGQKELPRVQVGVSLDGMFNRIAVAYNLADPVSGSQVRDTTAWTDNSKSQDTYGIKELLLSSSASSAAHAEAARDIKLSQVQYPTPVVSPALDADESEATLYLTGWWDTLDWRYYSNGVHADTDTATQIANILGSKGQFFEGVRREIISGLDVDEFRDGDGTALYEVMELLQMGTDNYRRMLATVDEHRYVTVYEEPAVPALPYILQPDGTILDSYGNLVRSETCPVAVWARQKDLLPATIDGALLADPSLLFVEEMEYDAESDRLIYLSRDALDPFRFAEVKDG